jgi:hypothetical protein
MKTGRFRDDNPGIACRIHRGAKKNSILSCLPGMAITGDAGRKTHFRAILKV